MTIYNSNYSCMITLTLFLEERDLKSQLRASEAMGAQYWVEYNSTP